MVMVVEPGLSARSMVPEGWVVHAYRFALDPAPAQEMMLRSHCGAARFAFNHMLGVVRMNLDQRAAERSYGVAEGDLTPSLNWSAFGLRKAWNQVKNEVAPWWRQNSKEAYACGVANLGAALSNWAASKSGRRKGPRMGFPKFKSKRSHLSCRFSTGAFGLVDTDRRHVQLPRIGVVRTHESTRKLARRITAGPRGSVRPPSRSCGVAGLCPSRWLSCRPAVSW
jgi:putative transposase